MAKVIHLFSGSSGNSILITSNGKSFLVDIGVSSKKCEQMLQDFNIDPKSIKAIFVTHEHSDHTAGVRVFSTKFDIPVYASQGTIDGMYQKKLINDKVNINALDRHITIDNVEIQSFKQSHDSNDCRGYRFNLHNSRSVCVCTDTGYITDEARSICNGCDLIFIESNHETSMVENGPYPYPLKQRVLSIYGHLSNFACGEYLKELAKSGTTRFVLSHLSKENNHPDLAMQNAIAALDEIGFKRDIDYRLYVSSPENTSGGIVL